MKLYKDGITVNPIHPQDIARFKKSGYVEVKEEEKVAEKQPSKTTKKDGE